MTLTTKRDDARLRLQEIGGVFCTVTLLMLAAFAGCAVRAVAAPTSQVAEAATSDPPFTQPYMDVDEWRDTPVHHRYVHGGFKGTETRVSLSSGAYFIETNGGGRALTGTPGSAVDSTIAAYRANAASAQYSRIVAMQMYGGRRPYGYLFGGSGGGYRTIGAMENTEDVWDGAVPYVIGSPMAIPNVFSVRMYAERVLKDELALVADAADVGGSGDI